MAGLFAGFLDDKKLGDLHTCVSMPIRGRSKTYPVLLLEMVLRWLELGILAHSDLVHTIFSLSV